MKKTFNINVAGFPFIIDDDAYTLLNDYLDTIEHAFASQEDARELVSDIESRVAELLLEKTSGGSPIITAQDVEEVIKRVGQPEEIIEEDETITYNPETGDTTTSEKTKETITPPPYIPPIPKAPKKLYRDPQNAMLGGVCSGFANYFNCDVTPIRLLTVLLTILSVATVGIAYLIFWIVVPEARTPLERMQMLGEEPTMENIGRTVTDNFKEDNGIATPKEPTGSRSFGDALASFFGILAKALVILGLIIGIPVLIALGLALIGCIFALITFGTSWGGTLFGEGLPDWYEEAGTIPIYGVVCGIGCILVFGIPLFLLIRMGLKKNRYPLSRSIRNTLTVIWVIGFIIGAAAAGRIVNLASENDRRNNDRWMEECRQIEQNDDVVAYTDSIWNENEDSTIIVEQSPMDSTSSSNGNDIPTEDNSSKHK